MAYSLHRHRDQKGISPQIILLRSYLFFCFSLFVLGCSLPRYYPGGAVAFVIGSIVDQKGIPVAGAYVYAYSRKTLPAIRRQPLLTGNVAIENDFGQASSPYLQEESLFRGPADYKSSLSDKQGFYKITLPPGQYNLVARKRTGDQLTRGPLGTRDFSSQLSVVTTLARDDSATMNFTLFDLAEDSFFDRHYALKSYTISLEGILLDHDKKPLEGYFVTADFRNRIGRRSDFLSGKTDKKGRFLLHIPHAGKIYLAAKEKRLSKAYAVQLFLGDRRQQSADFVLTDSLFEKTLTLIIKKREQ